MSLVFLHATRYGLAHTFINRRNLGYLFVYMFTTETRLRSRWTVLKTLARHDYEIRIEDTADGDAVVSLC